MIPKYAKWNIKRKLKPRFAAITQKLPWKKYTKSVFASAVAQNIYMYNLSVSSHTL